MLPAELPPVPTELLDSPPPADVPPVPTVDADPEPSEPDEEPPVPTELLDVPPPAEVPPVPSVEEDPEPLPEPADDPPVPTELLDSPPPAEVPPVPTVEAEPDPQSAPGAQSPAELPPVPTELLDVPPPAEVPPVPTVLLVWAKAESVVPATSAATNAVCLTMFMVVLLLFSRLDYARSCLSNRHFRFFVPGNARVTIRYVNLYRRVSTLRLKCRLVAREATLEHAIYRRKFGFLDSSWGRSP